MLAMSQAVGIVAVSLPSLMDTFRRASHLVESLAVALQGSFNLLALLGWGSLSVRRQTLFHVPYYFCTVKI
jgi:hypothetical protein